MSPLRVGWSLISFPLATCRHLGAPAPAVAVPTATTFQQVASVGALLSSIEGKYLVVRSFDAGGAHSYDPTLPDYLSDLTYLGPGYGYWVKVSEAGTLGY